MATPAVFYDLPTAQAYGTASGGIFLITLISKSRGGALVQIFIVEFPLNIPSQYQVRPGEFLAIPKLDGSYIYLTA